MRTLKFNVDGSVLKPDPSCDFANLVPGSNEVVVAEFKFSSEWAGVRKVAAFYSVLGREYTPQILQDGVRCFIPTHALERRSFKIQIMGIINGKKVQTNKLAVSQDGGKV